MVMPAEQQTQDDSVEFTEPGVADEDGADESVETDDSAPPEDSAAVAGGVNEIPATEAPRQAAPRPSPQANQAALDELQQRRNSDGEREWRAEVSRKARTYESRLQEAGYMPEQARDQARRYVQQEQAFRSQETEAATMIGHIQGRQMAAVHFMRKHGLANQQMLDDFMALQQAPTPAEMEREARRMKTERSLRAENTRLKQGRVAPQAFDNSQGAADASSSDQRLLEAYNNGDRSEAVVRAARRLALGA